MQIGSRVISKKVGVPVVGTIVAMYDGTYYKYMHARQNQMNQMFGVSSQDTFQDEFGEPSQVCLVVFDQPVRFYPMKNNTPSARMEYLMQQPVSQEVFGIEELEEISDEKFRVQKTFGGMESE